MRTRSQGALGLVALPDDLLARVFSHLPSFHDFGRVDCVCRAWRARGSPVEQALRVWAAALDARHAEVGVSIGIPSALRLRDTRELCYREHLRAARDASGLVAAGDNLSAAVNERGDLCVWGMIDVADEYNVSILADPEDSFNYGSRPDLVSMSDTHGGPVKQISAGKVHVLVLHIDGLVSSFGYGGEGRLGHGNHTSKASPLSITSLSRVTDIAAGGEHNMVLTAEGEVLSFGWGESGQLGHGDMEEQLKPRVIKSLLGVRIVTIAAGNAHSMVLTDEGTVLSFGDGEFGQLGHGDRAWAPQLVPKMIEALRGMCVVAIAAGDSHSMVLTDEGAVLSFGLGEDGQLGHGDEKDRLKPTTIEALRGVRVVAAAAGGFHSMVLTDEGSVLSFGRGKCGLLGHGDQEQQLVPKVIKALRGVRVAAIVPGTSGHSMVRTDEGIILSFGNGESGELGRGERHVRDWRTHDPDRVAFGEDPASCALVPHKVLPGPRYGPDDDYILEAQAIPM